MGMLRADKILDYIADPLRKCLRDENPYVRKTAALGVMKLYDMKPSLVEEHGFLDVLRDMVTDSNPMVRSSFAPSLLANSAHLLLSHPRSLPTPLSLSLRFKSP
jgi:AP-1 complex subunit beta-1